VKVVLLEDVPKLGKRGDVVNVADGYARNFLIPKRLAVMATEGEISRLKSEVLKKKEKEERRRKVLLEIKENLEGKEVILKAKAGNKGKLFGSITASEIAEAIKKTMGIDIDKKVVELASPIKEVGEHVVKLKLGLGIETEVKVRVEPEA